MLLLCLPARPRSGPAPWRPGPQSGPVEHLPSLTPHELTEFLLAVAPVRPVYIWGAPGSGKSALVEQFAADVGLECVSLVGTQLAPEDLIGVPEIINGRSRFCPPTLIARDAPYVLFLDELNASSHDVQKAFYSLIHDRRLGEWRLPEGSVVIGAGNRSSESALVRPLPAPLINRMIHVALRVDHRQWLEWAGAHGVHPWVQEYIMTRPDHLSSRAPKEQETFSSPRAWELLSDALKGFGERLTDEQLARCAQGTVSSAHATQFVAYVKQLRDRFQLQAILKGDISWPSDPGQLDVLHFLAGAFRAHLIKSLPAEPGQVAGESRTLAHRAKDLMVRLAEINLEIAQTVMTSDERGRTLPVWFKTELVQQLPKIVDRRR